MKAENMILVVAQGKHLRWEVGVGTIVYSKYEAFKNNLYVFLLL